MVMNINTRRIQCSGFLLEKKNSTRTTNCQISGKALGATICFVAMDALDTTAWPARYSSEPTNWTGISQKYWLIVCLLIWTNLTPADGCMWCVLGMIRRTRLLPSTSTNQQLQHVLLVDSLLAKNLAPAHCPWIIAFDDMLSLFAKYWYFMYW